MGDRFLELWDASRRVNRAASLASKLDLTVKEIRKLVMAHTAVVTTTAFDERARSRTVSSVDAQIGTDRTPDITIALCDRDEVEFGMLELYADPAHPFDEDDRRIAAMFADNAGISLAYTRTYQSSTGSESQFRQMVEMAREGIWTVDLEERLTYINHAVIDMLGYRYSDMIGRSIYDFLGTDETEVTRNIFDAQLIGRLGPREILLRRADGIFMWALVSSVNIHDNAGERTGALGVIVDISDRKRAEEALRAKQDALEAALKVNRGLISSALADRVSGEEQYRTIAEMTRVAAKRGLDMANKLLSLARQQTLDPKPSDINRLIARMEGLIRHVLEDNIEIVIKHSENLANALVERTLLETAILNIAVNARAAMPNGGRLTISTANKRLEASNAGLTTGTPPGAFVEITLADTGNGMDKDALVRVTKQFSESNPSTSGGLGMVYGFVRQSHGHMEIASEPGVGTVVRLYVPVCDAESEKVVATAPSEDADKELILLVDDNHLVRAFVEGQLESLGYRVISVESGSKALEILRANSSIDLLFTDVALHGGIDGYQLAVEAREMRAGIRVLFTSGYPEDMTADRRRPDDMPLLSKPFKRRELEEKVRLALDAGGKA